MLGMKGRRYKLCCSRNRDAVGGVGVMAKVELCEKVVEVRWKSDDSCRCFRRGYAEVDLWVCSTKWKKIGGKQSFYDELKCEWDSTDDLVMCLDDINGHVGRHIDDFDGVHEG